MGEYDPDKTYDVIILGGGFAGVAAGKVLGRIARKQPDFKVGLIASENHMVFQPLLPEVAAAAISPRHVVNPIRQLCPGVDVFKGKVRTIDVGERSVRLDPGDFTSNISIRAKTLVIGLGAKIDLSRVPGMTEHAMLMQNVGDAMKLRAVIIGRFEEANLLHDREKKRQLLRFVVVGGGYSGVETAGEILDLMVDMHRWYENVGRDDFEVVLVHSGAYVLPSLGEGLGEYAARKLQERGLRLVLQRRVKAVTATHVTLDNGDYISAGTVVSTVGNAPHPVVTELCEALGIETERGRIPVLNTLRVPGHDWLWAAGDCAMVPMKGGGFSPPTAQFASRQGTLLGKNLSALHRGAELHPFQFTGLGELAAIGHRTAVAEINGLRFSGFFAWWMWRTIYLSKLPGFQRKLRVLIDWTFDLFFPRDINLLNPQYSKPLKEIHLEPGDILFNAGEPAFSLYFVHEGAVEVRKVDQVVKTVKAGEYFGERALLEDRIWRFTAVATQPSRLVALAAREFDAIISGSVALQNLFRRSAQAYVPSDEFAVIREQLRPETLACPARELANRAIDALRPDMTLREALDLFRAKRHGSYPLVDSEGQVLGVIRRDALFDRLKSKGYSSDARVRELPVAELPVISAGATGANLAEVMTRSGRNKVLVVDDNNRLFGIVTMMDLLENTLNLASTDAD